ncbi:LAQU0S01e03180g1_1 [Lachancea quebecensis]|uniref:LAQU0S01e03180g1_1 n=1 Tax=Lachancea quebecensis TaxID=1654605 RepID=A0A0P1KLP1_9SACH|nr:LAQU0S01e03180g1_1 [Lachancea quebecensis]
MSTATHKPRLTGWAAAAAKAAPKTQSKPEKLPSSSLQATATRVAATAPTKASSGAKANPPTVATRAVPPPASTPVSKDATRKNKKTPRPAFNSEQVAQFLRSQFAAQSSQPNTAVYAKPKTHSSHGSPDWGTTTSKWKTKKYGCLSDVARSLRS